MFFLEVVEDGHRIPAEDCRGYKTLAEAQEAALRHVDDALPRNRVLILQLVGTARLGGDGAPYVRSEE